MSAIPECRQLRAPLVNGRYRELLFSQTFLIVDEQLTPFLGYKYSSVATKHDILITCAAARGGWRSVFDKGAVLQLPGGGMLSTRARQMITCARVEELGDQGKHDLAFNMLTSPGAYFG